MSEAPGLFVKVAIESFEGVLSFIEKDLPRAFRDLDDLHILGDLADASTDAAGSLREYIGYLRDTLAPKSRATFRIGRKQFEQKLRFDEGIDIPSDQLLESFVLRRRNLLELLVPLLVTLLRPGVK